MAQVNQMIIYALIDPRTGEIRYVGKTTRSPQNRLARHLSPCSLRGESYKERWIRAVLAAGLKPTLKIIESCQSPEALSEAEIFHIRRLRELGAKLTNTTPGGDGGGAPHTEESKAKISRANKGRRRPLWIGQRVAAANRARHVSEETRSRMSRSRRGRKGRSPGDRERQIISKKKGGRPFSDAEGNVYPTQKGAARQLGINVGHLNEVLHGTRSHVAGRVFRFIEIHEFPK